MHYLTALQLFGAAGIGLVYGAPPAEFGLPFESLTIQCSTSSAETGSPPPDTSWTVVNTACARTKTVRSTTTITPTPIRKTKTVKVTAAGISSSTPRRVGAGKSLLTSFPGTVITTTTTTLVVKAISTSSVPAPAGFRPARGTIVDGVSLSKRDDPEDDGTGTDDSGEPVMLLSVPDDTGSSSLDDSLIPVNTTSSAPLDTTTADPVDSTTSDLLSTTTSDLFSTILGDVLSTTSSSLVSTTTSSLLDVTATDSADTTAGGFLSTMTSDALSTTISEPLATTTNDLVIATTGDLVSPTTIDPLTTTTSDLMSTTTSDPLSTAPTDPMDDPTDDSGATSANDTGIVSRPPFYILAGQAPDLVTCSIIFFRRPCHRVTRTALRTKTLPAKTSTISVTVTVPAKTRRAETTSLVTITSTATEVYTVYTSTTTSYAACATNNLISQVNGQYIRRFGDQTDSYTTDAGNATDCCIQAVTSNTNLFGYNNGSCILYPNGGSCQSNPAGFIQASSGTSQADGFIAGNGLCGGILHAVSS